MSTKPLPLPRANNGALNPASYQQLRRDTTVKIDLGSAGGNAFALMAIAYQVARNCGMSEKSARDITAAMRTGTYIDLLNTMEQEFPGVFQFLGDPRVET